jgi:outer membrane biosynthesis protein TonB
MSNTDPASTAAKKSAPKIVRTPKKTPKQPKKDPLPEGVTEVQPKESKTKTPRGLDAHGFRVGSDSSKIVEIMLAGGIDRQDINDKVSAAIEPMTRVRTLPDGSTTGGRKKNIPSLISGLIGRLEDRGYFQESEWRLVPPTPAKKKR